MKQDKYTMDPGRQIYFSKLMIFEQNQKTIAEQNFEKKQNFGEKILKK